MSLSIGFQSVLLCSFSLLVLTTGYTVVNIFGSHDNDSLLGTSGYDGGNGDDVLYGGPGVDRLYGGPGADRFVFVVDEAGTDEVMDFSPEQNDTVMLQSRYTEMDINTTTDEFTGEKVRIDDEGSVEVQSQDGNWVTAARLNQTNLKINGREVAGGLQLFFTRQF